MKVEITLAIILVLLALEIKNFVLEGGLGKEIAYSLSKLIALTALSLYCIFLLKMPNIVHENLQEIITRERQKIERNKFKSEMEERQNWRRNELPIIRPDPNLYSRALRRRSVS